MNYLIDLRNVIQKSPIYFKKFCEDLIKTNNQVIIISGLRKTNAQKKLANIDFQPGISYTKIVSISDLVLESCAPSEIEFDYYNNVWVDDALWGRFRSEVCESYHIQIFMDGSDNYFPFISDAVIKLCITA